MIFSYPVGLDKIWRKNLIKTSIEVDSYLKEISLSHLALISNLVDTPANISYHNAYLFKRYKKILIKPLSLNIKTKPVIVN